MLVATIRSKPLPRMQFNKMQDGVYEIDVVVNPYEARQSGDPIGFIQREIAAHLAGCVRTSQLPLGFGLWDITFTQEAQQQFNFPSGFTA